MRILFLSPYPPYPPRSGGALRIYNLMRGLAARHEVWCLTFAPDDAAVEALTPLRELCRVVTVRGPLPRSLARRALTTLASPQPDMALRNASEAYGAALDQLLRANAFDVVHAASIEMAPHGLRARRAGAAAWLDEFNAEYVLQRRTALADLQNPKATILNPKSLLGIAYSLVQWQKLAAYERRALRRFSGVLAVSEEDRRALLRLDPALNIAIVPNGVDTDYFAPQAAVGGQRAAVVFTGTLDFRPNVDALRWFVAQALPLIRRRRPDAHLLAVGRSPSAAVRALAGPAVTIHADVPDVRPFVAGAAAYVVPMRMGGGVRLKLLEALAMEAPVVSTALGAEGVEGLQAGAHLLLADDAEGFADAVLRLLEAPALGRALGAAGRQLVAQRYDWRAIVPALERAYGWGG
jgi:glycosyltransferase involved in cell wall biosynthesis